MPSPQDYDKNQPHLPAFAGDASPDVKSGKYMFIDRPAYNPILYQNGTQAAPVGIPTFPTAVQDNVNTLVFPGGYGNKVIEMYQTTAQTLMPLVHASKGLEVALDQVNNESVEYVLGGNRASNPLAYLAGTDPGVFVRATFEITTSNGLDQFGIFWRKQEAYAVPVSFLNTGDPLYTDIVLFGFAGAVATPNQVRTSTDIGNLGSAIATATNFFWTSGQIHTLEIRIKGRAVSYYLNGARLGDRISKDGVGTTIASQTTIAPPAYTVTSGLTMIPGFFIRQDAALSTVFLRRVVCGRLAEEGLDRSGRVAA